MRNETSSRYLGVPGVESGDLKSSADASEVREFHIEATTANPVGRAINPADYREFICGWQLERRLERLISATKPGRRLRFTHKKSSSARP